jgi:hypothetical protein
MNWFRRGDRTPAPVKGLIVLVGSFVIPDGLLQEDRHSGSLRASRGHDAQVYDGLTEIYRPRLDFASASASRVSLWTAPSNWGSLGPKLRPSLEMIDDNALRGTGRRSSQRLRHYPVHQAEEVLRCAHLRPVVQPAESSTVSLLGQGLSVLANARAEAPCHLSYRPARSPSIVLEHPWQHRRRRTVGRPGESEKPPDPEGSDGFSRKPTDRGDQLGSAPDHAQMSVLPNLGRHACWIAGRPARSSVCCT